jgi:hypothetical protein
MKLPQEISFHDSGIVGVRRENNSIILTLENVTVADGKSEGHGWSLRQATVRLTGVREISCDDKPVADLVPVYESGEVWTLEHTTDSVHLIVDWTDYETHRSQTQSYRISCDSLQVEIH